MRVLVLSDWFPESGNEVAGSFVRTQALTIAARHEVTVVHLRRPADGDGRPRLAETADGPLRVLRLRNGWLGSASATNLWTVAAVLRRLGGEGRLPELLHAHEMGAGLAAVLAGRSLGMPVVVSEHASAFATGAVTGVAAGVARLVFAAADVVCPVSESQRLTLTSGGWGGHHRVVPNPVDTERFTPAASPPDGQPLIVTVAALEPVKGITDLIEAVALLGRRRQDFHLRLVGDGALARELARRVDELALTDRVTLAGPVAHDELPDLMRTASFVVIPSRWETFSVVLSEAMASGLPVVATAVGAIPERVDDSIGLLCPPDDPPALADAIDAMLDRHGDFDRHAIAARADALWSPAAIAEQWERVYDEATTRRNRRIVGRRRPRAAAGASS